MKYHRKAQVTIINLMVVLMIMITFFVFLPIIIQFTNTQAVPAIASSTSDAPTKDLMLALVQLFPVVVILMIIVSAFNYAIPRREGYG